MQRKEAALCALMTIALLGFPVLLCVKYSSFSFSDKISWPIVFVPLWAMILLYFAVPAYNCRSMNFPTYVLRPSPSSLFVTLAAVMCAQVALRSGDGAVSDAGDHCHHRRAGAHGQGVARHAVDRDSVLDTGRSGHCHCRRLGCIVRRVVELRDVGAAQGA
jgi:hypothetical protein